ncbi:hypothetical protein BC831DRAFT_488535 [Entophlyctis helioformis]|nr:hypothetical protein BC831DRAFT_488535 [Entophlyctis helioformis]
MLAAALLTALAATAPALVRAQGAPSIPLPTIPSATTPLNPALTPACATAFNQTLAQFTAACNVPSLSANVTVNSFDTPTLDRLCSASCTTATNSFASSLQSACGDQVIYLPAANATATPPAAPQNVANIASSLKLSSNFFCLKDNNAYCFPQEIAELTKTTKSTDLGALAAGLLNPAFLCTSCATKHIKILQDSKSYYADYAQIDTLVQLVAPITATCKLTTGGSSTGNAAVSLSSPLMVVSAAVAAALAALL